MRQALRRFRYAPSAMRPIAHAQQVFCQHKLSRMDCGGNPGPRRGTVVFLFSRGGFSEKLSVPGQYRSGPCPF